MHASEGSTIRETVYDPTSFSAGWKCGTRVAACVARSAALELVDSARWWNRWRIRLMAKALVTCADELEREPADDASAASERRPDPILHVLAAE